MKNFHPHSCPRCTKEFKETGQLLSHLKNNPNCKKDEGKKVDETKKVVIKRERDDEMKEESEEKPKKLKVCLYLYQSRELRQFTI